MNIAFISYWGINDPLSVATVLPHVKILAAMPKVEKIFLLSFERGPNAEIVLQENVQHIPIVEKRFPPGLNKFLSFARGWKQLKKIHKSSTIDYCFCRSSFAGILGYHLNKKFNVPFIVESLEPHTDYMIESEEWNKNGIKSKILRSYEEKIFEHADYLLPVSQNYLNRLLNKGVNKNKLRLLPCTIDAIKFQFNETIRRSIRKQCNFSDDDIVGIYVGKFGGIYYDRQAFDLFKSLKSHLNNFKLIILSPNERKEVEKELFSIGFTTSDFVMKKARPNEVPNFLSSSDFGIAIYKESSFSQCLSPIKVGEYLVNGLPVLIPERIGDDSDIVKSYGIGELFTFSDGDGTLKMELSGLHYILEKKDSRDIVSKVGRKYRNRDISKIVYKDILK